MSLPASDQAAEVAAMFLMRHHHHLRVSFIASWQGGFPERVYVACLPSKTVRFFRHVKYYATDCTGELRSSQKDHLNCHCWHRAGFLHRKTFRKNRLPLNEAKDPARTWKYAYPKATEPWGPCWIDTTWNKPCQIIKHKSLGVGSSPNLIWAYIRSARLSLVHCLYQTKHATSRTMVWDSRPIRVLLPK